MAELRIEVEDPPRLRGVDAPKSTVKAAVMSGMRRHAWEVPDTGRFEAIFLDNEGRAWIAFVFVIRKQGVGIVFAYAPVKQPAEAESWLRLLRHVHDNYCSPIRNPFIDAKCHSQASIDLAVRKLNRLVEALDAYYQTLPPPLQAETGSLLRRAHAELDAFWDDEERLRLEQAISSAHEIMRLAGDRLGFCDFRAA